MHIDRYTEEISAPELVEIPDSELAEAVLAGTGQHVAESGRFVDGALSVGYKVSTVEEKNEDLAYVVQLRHHGVVASMDAIMMMIAVDRDVLPVPQPYPIPGERQRQEATGFGRQITRFIPGIMAGDVYASLAYEKKLGFVRQMARAFRACWDVQLPEPRLIGEVMVEEIDGQVVLKIEPDRHYGLGGPFTSVREYLRAYIKSSLVALEKQEDIEEYKNRYLERIKHFISHHLDKIPAVVETIPIVFSHADMGPHSVIIASETSPNIKAVVDWEFVSSAPYASQHRVIEMLFREAAHNGFGREYEGAEKLREAFWEEMPEWREWNRTETVEVFLEWFRFGLFMKAEGWSEGPE